MMTFAHWLREQNQTQGCVVGRAGTRTYVVPVGPQLFLCLNVGANAGWTCRGDQLGAWFRGDEVAQLVPITLEHVQAFAHRLADT